MSISILSNGVVCFRFELAQGCQVLFDRLQSFLNPCFTSVPLNGSEPDLTIVLRDIRAFDTSQMQRCVQPFQIRLSRAPGFTLNVQVGEDEVGRRLAWDGDTGVGYRIDAPAHSIEFYAGEGGFIHLIELVRYYGLRVEQSRGTCVLHASAVVDVHTGLVTAIAGLKGAGKTTAMFALVEKGVNHYFSGDKLLLDVYGDGVRARAWPDFPYIGVGTLRSYPRFAERFGLENVLADAALDPRRKFLVDPAIFHRTVPIAPAAEGPLAAVLLPDVDYAGTARMSLLNATEILEVLAVPGIFEWPHEFCVATWHGIEPADALASTEASALLLERLARLPWKRRDGKLEKQR